MKNRIPISFECKSFLKSYAESYTDSYTCRLPLKQLRGRFHSQSLLFLSPTGDTLIWETSALGRGDCQRDSQRSLPGMTHIWAQILSTTPYWVLSTFNNIYVPTRARTARVEKDWTRTRCQLRITADFCPLYFNDCTALLGLITMEPVIRSRNFFLIHDQGHILS
jgi:hypothetical protein